jgi:PAS domain S-box-containing protein
MTPAPSRASREAITGVPEPAAATDTTPEALRRALAAAHIGTWTLDPVAETVAFDTVIASLLGLDPERTTVGCAELAALVHPEDRDAAWVALRTLRSPGEPVEDVVRILRADGEMRWLRLTQMPDPEGPGRRGRLTGLAQDITTWKRAEQRLRVDAAVSRVLATADSVSACAAGVLNVIGSELGIEYCGLWLPEQGGEVIHCVETYTSGDGEQRFARFLEHTHRARVRGGEGLVGAVWGTGRSVWLSSVSGDRSFRRIRAAMADGLTSFVAFPLLAGPSLLGVIDMFSVRPLPPDPLLLDTLSGLGSEFAQYLLRDRVEQALRESEGRFRTVVEASPSGIVLTDQRGRISMANPQAERALGYAPGELLGRSIDLLLPQRLRTAHRGQRRSYLEAPTSRAMGAGRDLFARRKDGTEIPVEVALTPIPAEDGPMVLATLVDITERRQVERTLRESEERFRGTFENAAVGFGHVDLEGRWLRVNARLCEITGYAREDLLERTFQEITHPQDLDRDLALVRRLLDGEIGTYSMEKRYLRPDGQPVWVQLTVSLIRTSDGSPDHFIAVVEDIGDRKDAEARLRTALAVKDEFLGLVSHELRTPMTIILGMSAIIARGRLDGQRAQEVAADIADSADVLNDLIESMLLLARLDHEEDQPREPLLLNRVAAAVLERQRRRDTARRYDLAVHTTETLVEAQLTWLDRVIANLVGNASKYSRPGGEVRLVIEHGEDEVMVRVLDEGPGLSEEDLGQVFEPFYRAPGAERRAPGTGLGLAISKRIVESLGGRIWARTLPSGGSDFGFALPLVQDEDP